MTIIVRASWNERRKIRAKKKLGEGRSPSLTARDLPKVAVILGPVALFTFGVRDSGTGFFFTLFVREASQTELLMVAGKEKPI